MKKYIDAAALLVAFIGVATVIVSPVQSFFVYVGLALAFAGAVVYGGIPSQNPVEQAVAKVPVPTLILAVSLASVLWKITSPEVFFQDILWWGFGSFVIGTIISPAVQNLLSN